MEKTIATIGNMREADCKTCNLLYGEKQGTVIHNVNDLTTSSVISQLPSTIEIQSDNITVLVVDDDTNIRKLLTELIMHAGYNCLDAESVSHALMILENTCVDVVITDLRMPGQDGIELTQIVKREYDADVIVMTGYSDDLTYEEVIGHGARDFLKKPFNTREMLVRLKRVLKDRVILSGFNIMELKLKYSLVKLTRVLEQTVNALASAVEKRDPYTAGHQRRVTQLACSITEELDLSKEEIKGIRIAGLLHDIGKISIPIDILNKPGKLNKHEFNLIKDHPQVGYEILNDIEFDQPVAQTIRQHHERIDGSGYPQGLSGKDIILQARILALSDVVEAMASHRPYRPAVGIESALKEISENKGIFYDSDVVDACLTLFNEKHFMFA